MAALLLSLTAPPQLETIEQHVADIADQVRINHVPIDYSRQQMMQRQEEIDKKISRLERTVIGSGNPVVELRKEAGSKDVRCI
jgi:hypothetical protein